MTPRESFIGRQLQLLGVLPLLFFLSRFAEYIKVGTPSHILWNCHISNLMLGLGLIFQQPILIRVAAFWLILGIPPWIVDMFVIRIFSPVAFFSHVGGFVAAIWVVSQIGIKSGSWIYALGWHLVWQQVSRAVTPAVYNINIADRPYKGFEGFFSAYWQYWLVAAALAGFFLWGLEKLLLLIFRQGKKASPSGLSGSSTGV